MSKVYKKLLRGHLAMENGSTGFPFFIFLFLGKQEKDKFFWSISSFLFRLLDMQGTSFCQFSEK